MPVDGCLHDLLNEIFSNVCDKSIDSYAPYYHCEEPEENAYLKAKAWIDIDFTKEFQDYVSIFVFACIDSGAPDPKPYSPGTDLLGESGISVESYTFIPPITESTLMRKYFVIEVRLPTLSKILRKA